MKRTWIVAALLLLGCEPPVRQTPFAPPPIEEPDPAPLVPVGDQVIVSGGGVDSLTLPRAIFAPDSLYVTITAQIPRTYEVVFAVSDTSRVKLLIDRLDYFVGSEAPTLALVPADEWGSIVSRAEQVVVLTAEFGIAAVPFTRTFAIPVEYRSTERSLTHVLWQIDTPDPEGQEQPIEPKLAIIETFGDW